MPTPVGHALGGLAVYLAATRGDVRRELGLGVACVGVAMLPDLDFAIGRLQGELPPLQKGTGTFLSGKGSKKVPVPFCASNGTGIDAPALINSYKILSRSCGPDSPRPPFL